MWHLDEPLARLSGLCDDWPLVCMGSAGEWATVGDDAWKRRMDDAMVACCDSTGRPRTNLHMDAGRAGRVVRGPEREARADYHRNAVMWQLLIPHHAFALAGFDPATGSALAYMESRYQTGGPCACRRRS